MEKWEKWRNEIKEHYTAVCNARNSIYNKFGNYIGSVTIETSNQGLRLLECISSEVKSIEYVSRDLNRKMVSYVQHHSQAQDSSTVARTLYESLEAYLGAIRESLRDALSKIYEFSAVEMSHVNEIKVDDLDERMLELETGRLHDEYQLVRMIINDSLIDIAVLLKKFHTLLSNDRNLEELVNIELYSDDITN